MAERKRKRRSSAPRRRGRVARILPIVVLVAVAYFYYRPISAWIDTRSALAHREAQVASLERQKAKLDRQVTRAASLPSLARRARRIGLVREGEQLFIIKGIPAWKRAHP